MSPLSNDLLFWRDACKEVDDSISFLSYNNQFVCCNPSWCDLLGYTEEEIQGKTWTFITREIDMQNDYKIFNKIKDMANEEYYLKKICTGRESNILTKMYIRNVPDLNGFIIIARKIGIKDYEQLKTKFLDLRQKVLFAKQRDLSQQCIIDNHGIARCKLVQNIIMKDAKKNIVDDTKNKAKNLIVPLMSGVLLVSLFLLLSLL